MTVGGSGLAAGGERLAVRVARAGRAPLVAIRVWLAGGSRVERRPGEALVAGRLLVEGSRRRTFDRIALDAEGRGLSVSSGAGLEVTEVAVDGPATEWRRALDWAAELAREPAFPAERAAWIRRQAESGACVAAFDDPAYRTAWAFLDQLYRPHPAGRPRAGGAEALRAVAVEGCRAQHRRSLDGRVIVSIAGQIEEAAVERRARELFGDLDGPPRRGAQPPAPVGSGAARTEVTLERGEQAHLYLGRRTVRRDDPDLPALVVAGVVLGAGELLAGRIPFRVREREGLAYSVQVETVAGAGLDPGRLVVYCATAAGSVERARRAVLEELERAASTLRAEEVEEARAYLLGREPFRRETASQVATLAAEAELYGLPIADPDWVRGRLEAVTKADVERATAAWLGAEKLATTVGRPGG